MAIKEIKVTLPSISTPIADRSGVTLPEWYRYFEQSLLRSGGATDISITFQQYVIDSIAAITFPVSSVFGRTGAILATLGDYTFSLIGGLIGYSQLAPALVAYQRIAPGTGFAQTIADEVAALIIVPAAGLATGTITMPANPHDGQRVKIASSQAIAALTINANAGQTIAGAITVIAANGFAEYQYILGDTKWYRTG